MDSVSLGVWVGRGVARYEIRPLERRFRISSSILLFKRHAPAAAPSRISQTVEGGGRLPSMPLRVRKQPATYAKASHKHFNTLLDVLADMYLHSRFAASRD